jgi:hypothetical protein
MVRVDHRRRFIKHAFVFLSKVKDSFRVLRSHILYIQFLADAEIRPRNDSDSVSIDDFVELMAFVPTPSSTALTAMTKVVVVIVALSAMIPLTPRCLATTIAADSSLWFANPNRVMYFCVLQ